MPDTYYQSSLTGGQIESVLTGAVVFNDSQELTDIQKERARDNIGAMSEDGAAASAAKLATARTIQTNLASTTAASFDGTANVTPGVTGVLPRTSGGTGTNSEILKRVNLEDSGYDVILSPYNTDIPVIGTLPIANGGTGATTAAAARTALGLGAAATAGLDSTPTQSSNNAVKSGGVFAAISPAQFQFLNTFYISTSATAVGDNFYPVVDGFTGVMSFPSQVSVRGRTSNIVIAAGSSIQLKTNMANTAVFISSEGVLSTDANGNVPANAHAIIAFVQYRRGSWYVFSASPIICRGPVNGNVVHRDDFEIRDIAHKGNENIVAPENTLSGFKAALENGFTWFECDLRKTQDGQWVMLHDTSINATARVKTTGAAPSSTINVNASTLADLNNTYTFCGNNTLYPKFKDEPIPTLEETLAFARASGMSIRLELKLSMQFDGCKQVASIIESYGMMDRVEFHSATYSALWYMAQAINNGMLSLLTSSTTITDDIIDQLTQLSIHGNKVGLAVPIDTPASELEKVTKYGWYISVRDTDDATAVAGAPPCVSAFTTNTLINPKPSEIIRNANLFPFRSIAAIASGSFFMLGDRVYQATAAIAQFDDIIPGTNCTEYRDIAAVLNSLS